MTGVQTCALPISIVCAMDLIPQFKKTAGVQKMHTVFLTDGASNSIQIGRASCRERV